MGTKRTLRNKMVVYKFTTAQDSRPLAHLFPLVLVHALVNGALNELREQRPLRVGEDEGGELLARHDLAVLFLHHDVEQAVHDRLQLLLLHVEQHLALLEEDVDVARPPDLRGKRAVLSTVPRVLHRDFWTCLIGEVLLLDQLHLRPEEGRVVQRVVDVLVVQGVLAVRERNREPPAAAGHLAFQAAH